MITKDINGNTLPASYDDLIASDTRDFAVRVVADGNILSCAVKSLSIDKGSCGTQDNFSIGSVISSSLSMVLTDVASLLHGTIIEIQAGLYAGSDYVYITVGTFKAVDVKRTAYSTTVQAYGHTMASMAGSFVVPSVLSLANIASAITTATGIDIVFDSGIDTAQVISTLPADCSCYNALQIMASVCGGYVIDTNDGKVAVKSYSAVATLAVDAGRMLKLPNVSEAPFSITGVQVTATGQYQYALTTDTSINPDKTYYIRSGTAPDYVYTEVVEPVASELSTYYERSDVVYTYGTPVVLYDENPYMSAGLFNIYKGIVGYSYYYGDIDLSLGDPRIEGDDVLTVTDVNGNVYTVPCHIITHTYDGGWLNKIVASKPTAQGEDIPQTAPITQRLDNIAMATAQAQASAETAKEASAVAVYEAGQAKIASEEAKTSAEQAQTSAQQASESAQQASAQASEAQLQAGIANVYANSALTQLGVVEDIVGVLDLLSKNGTYALTQDEEPQGGKWYFTRSGTAPNYTYAVVNNIDYSYLKTKDTDVVSGKTYYTRSATEPYVYTEVENPVTADIGTYYEYTNSPYTYGYYELTGIDEAIQNYVSSQLVVTDAGLWLQTAGVQSKVLLSATDGVVLYGTDGTIVGKYGATAQIGDSASFHIEMDGTELGFYQGQNKVAYISNQQLYITQSVVLQQMDLGIQANNGGLGQWSWKVHPNGQTPSRNNLNLKWIG